MVSMRTLRFIPAFVAIGLVMLSLFACSKYIESEEINGLLTNNDIQIRLTVENNPDGYTLTNLNEDESGDCVKIDVTDEFSLRGVADITPGRRYRVSFTLKNTDADPVIGYSFWKGSVTSVRHYTFNGENGNPPSSVTKESYSEWRTFDEAFETREGEDSFLMTLLSFKGTFYIKEISIKLIN
jgi:hypothetical protein